MATKLAIVYYSSTGSNYKLAKWAEEAAKELGAEVRLRKVQELAPQAIIDGQPAWKATQEATKDIPVAQVGDLEWADAFVFSIPTRFGMMPSQLRQFLDTTGGPAMSGKFVNKVVSAMSTAGNANGGQEATILSFYTNMYHWGAIVAAPGYTDFPSISAIGGNPYGTSITVGQDGSFVEGEEAAKAAVRHQAKRTIQVAEALIKGFA